MSLPRTLLQVAILLATTYTIAQTQTTSAPQAAAPTQEIQHLTRLATTTIKAGPVGSGAYALPEIASQPSAGLTGDAAVVSAARHASNLPIPSKEAARLAMASRRSSARRNAAGLPLPEPSVHGSMVVDYQGSGFIGFNGLDDVDQRTANNGNQYSLEPPDQGLCAGNGFVVETVNDVIRVFDGVGNPLTGVEDLNSFFGLAPAIIRGSPNVTGPSIGDPRCLYDAQTKRWFVTVYDEDFGTNVGATDRYYNLIAVSQTSDPTGAFTVFQYDVTDDGMNGTLIHAGCPCFGDQPLLGADQYGIYQSTNEFGTGTFNGSQIYAIPKAQLVADAAPTSTVGPIVLHIDASQQLIPFGGLSYTLQPARSASSTSYEKASNGVEYFLSALQFGNPGYEVYDDRIAVWALTNTKTLSTNFPLLNLLVNVIHSETYGQPDPAAQKPGETPLGTLLGDPLELINTNDDRMNQVIYSNGILYGGVNSKLKVGGASQTGIAWFAVQPSLGATFNANVVNQGYVAVTGNNVIFPSVGVDRDGDGAIVFTLVGPSYFPSVAYSPLSDLTVSQVVHIAAAGQDPDDGFTGYKQYTGGNVARWGDYSAATSDGERVWFASEYIPNACAVDGPPCREVLFNWGTFIGSILP